jgi:tRNA pseudouridine55 synthase
VIGFLVVDKEAGCTSHDVVARCRRMLGERRIGHAGTLDPSATGVLVLAVGRATRLLRFVSGGTKEYRAEVVLGTTTTTLDEDGDVLERFDMDGLTLADVRAAADGLTGEIDQRVPMVSAVKVGGRRLHRLARAGIEIERPVRRIRVDRFVVADGPEPGVFAVQVTCSAGTYVRVLAAELGAALGGGAHLRRLRRIRSGHFGEADAHQLHEIDAELAAGRSVLKGPLEALHLPSVAVPAELCPAVGHGRPLESVGLGAPAAGPFAVTDADGQLLAVYEAAPGERLAKPAVVLAPS